MRNHLIASCFWTLTMIAGPATAQQSPSAVGAPGLKPEDFVTTSRAHQWRASKLIGLDVFGTDNEKLGDVSEVLIEIDGNDVVIINVGGFPGIAGREVALPFKAVECRYGKPPTSTPTEGFGASSGRDVTSRQTIDTTTQRYPDFPVLRITKADLKTAPEFHYQRPAVR